MFNCHLVLFLRLLHRPVEVVQLKLAEVHHVAVLVHDLLESGKVSVAGKAQEPDPALLFLLHEIVDDAPLGILVGLK